MGWRVGGFLLMVLCSILRLLRKKVGGWFAGMVK